MGPVQRLRRARFRSTAARYATVRLRHRGLRTNDAFLVSYPRSGTTWLRFLLSEALTGRSPEFTPDPALVPYVGEHRGAEGILPDGGRVIMSHELFPVGGRRVLYIVRDPRAVALSEFRWLRRRGLTDDDLDAFLTDFVAGRSNPWGGWGAHVERWRTSEAAAAGLFRMTRYEDLRADPVGVLRGLLRFLGATVSDDRIEAAVANNSLEAMQRKEERAPDSAFAKGVRRDVRFVRTGAVSGWRAELSSEQTAKIGAAFVETMQRLDYAPDGTGADPGRNG